MIATEQSDRCLWSVKRLAAGYKTYLKRDLKLSTTEKKNLQNRLNHQLGVIFFYRHWFYYNNMLRNPDDNY